MQAHAKTDQQESLLQLNQAEEPPKDRKVLAIFFANGFTICASIYLTGVKLLLLSGMGYLEILLMIYTLGVVVSYLIVKFNGKGMFSDIDTPTRRWDIFLRSLNALLAMVVLTTIVGIIPLSIFSILVNSSGFWSSILGYFLFGDRLHPKEIAGIVIGYLGLSMIILGYDSEQSVESGAMFYFGVGLGFLGSVMVAFTQVLSRKLRGVHFSVVHFTYNLFGITVILAVLLTEFVVTGMKFGSEYTVQQWLWLALFCFFQGMGILLYTGAFQMEKAGAVSIVLYIQVLYNFLIDVFVFGYSFTPVQILGAIIILSVNVFIGVLKLQKKL